MSKKRIRIEGREFEVLLSSRRISRRVREISATLSEEYKGKDTLILPVLNGSFIFAADLIRDMDIDTEISFIKIASYRGTTSGFDPAELIGLGTDIRNRHVLILEDIIDTGTTLSKLIGKILEYQPASVRTACLLFKPEANITNIKPDFAGFEIPNDFVIGYGLDYNGYGRKYKDIYVLVTEG